MIQIYPTFRPTLAHRFLQFPLTRMVLPVLAFMLPFLLLQAGATRFFDEKIFVRCGQLVAACVAYVTYIWVMRNIEKRVPTELARTGAVSEFFLGFGIGSALIALAVGALMWLGAYEVQGISPLTVVAVPLMLHLIVGMIEELVVRGVIFRVLQEYLGSYFTLALTSIFFGFLHLMNDHITWLSFANIVALGALLGAAFLLTGRLWMCVALHAAWNFTQDGIFSINVSGQVVKNGLVFGKLSGPDWLTGGAFGLEGSAITLILLAISTAVTIALARRAKRIAVPVWQR